MTAALLRLARLFALLALLVAAPAWGGDEAPAQDPVLAAVADLARPPQPGGPAIPRLLWARYGLDASDRALVGDLVALAEAMRQAPTAVRVTVQGVGGTAPHRNATARVEVPRGAYRVLLAEEDGWRLVRADPPPSEEAGDAAAQASAAARAVMAAVDGRDAAAFAALASDPTGARARLDAKDVEDFLGELHQKYGGRPHRVGAVSSAVEGSAPGTRRWTVPVLFEDAEDLVNLTFSRVDGRMRLARIEDGRPQDFVPAPDERTGGDHAPGTEPAPPPRPK